MSRLFQPIPANPTFGVLQKNGYASDYTQKIKLREVFVDSIKNQRRRNLSQSQLLNLKNCELKKNIIYNQVYLDKTNLIAGLFSNENLEGITTLCTRGEVDPETNLPTCLQEVTTIDITKQPFYGYYSIDPNGELFGNTQCGLNNFKNYMQINIPIIPLSTSLQVCIPQCNSRADDVCALVCANPDVINNVTYPYQLGSPWPHFGGLYNNNARLSPYLGPQTSNVKWVFVKGNASAIESTPIIGRDGTIYFGSLDTYFYALNSNGTLKWTYITGGQIWSSAAISSDGTIYVGSRDNYLYALNPDGTLKWKYNIGDTLSSPAIGLDGTIYISSYNYNLYAMNPDGTLKWSYTTGGAIVNSSPAIGSDGTIYVGNNNHYLYAINSDGSEKWKYLTGNAIESSPAIGSDGTIYVGSRDNYLYAINPNGSEKWKYLTGTAITSSPAIGSDGTIYIGSNGIYAINPNGIIKWVFPTKQFLQASPAIGSDGAIYISQQGWWFYALNPDGSEKWVNGEVPGNGSSPTIGSDGTLYVGSDDNKLYALN